MARGARKENRGSACEAARQRVATSPAADGTQRHDLPLNGRHAPSGSFRLDQRPYRKPGTGKGKLRRLQGRGDMG
ncbi:hypothetical protein [Hoylesella shahii]|uniref:hypothetical protein n=1 Tax=Hoylesella shahii TaxID=228603 RepID=UPI00248D73B9|nr:hypothetical protein [Hoylesella shahii]